MSDALPTPQTQDRRAEILRSAAALFCVKGFHGTSMGEVADAVQLTKAGLYYYVRGKEDLLFSIASFAMDRLEAWIDAVRNVEDPAEQVLGVIRSHAEGITRDGSAITLMVDAVDALSPDHRRTIRDRQRAYVDFVRERLERLAVDGRLRAVDPTVAAFSILGSVMWTARWYRPEGALDGAEVAAQITTIAAGGLLKEESE